MLEVFVVFYRDYDNAYVEGVYASMDAVRTAYPGIWKPEHPRLAESRSRYWIGPRKGLEAERHLVHA